MSERATRIRLQTSSVTVSISLALVLFMLGLAGWIMLNFKNLTTNIKEKFSMQVMLNENVTEANIDKLRKQLDAAAFVKEATYIPKDVAAEEMKKELGEDFISFLGDNPIPPSINVKLRSEYVNTDSLKWISTEIKSMADRKSVKDVVYKEILAQELDRNYKDIGLVILILAALLTIVAVGLINNTIRLSIYSKRFLLRTMYLVGATRSFIRKPFIIRGIRQGVVAGILACFLIGGFIFMLIKIFPLLLLNQDRNELILLMGGIIVLGVLISAISSALAVSRYLRLKQEDLHF